MASPNVLNVTDTTFDAEVLKSDKPVLVDFWAPWCGPCIQLGPVIDQVADATAGKAKVAKVNVDECQQVPPSIASIPSPPCWSSRAENCGSNSIPAPKATSSQSWKRWPKRRAQEIFTPRFREKARRFFGRRGACREGC